MANLDPNQRGSRQLQIDELKKTLNTVLEELVGIKARLDVLEEEDVPEEPGEPE